MSEMQCVAHEEWGNIFQIHPSGLSISVRFIRLNDIETLSLPHGLSAKVHSDRSSALQVFRHDGQAEKQCPLQAKTFSLKGRCEGR